MHLRKIINDIRTHIHVRDNRNTQEGRRGERGVGRGREGRKGEGVRGEEKGKCQPFTRYKGDNN